MIAHHIAGPGGGRSQKSLVREIGVASMRGVVRTDVGLRRSYQSPPLQPSGDGFGRCPVCTKGEGAGPINKGKCRVGEGSVVWEGLRVGPGWGHV